MSYYRQNKIQNRKSIFEKKHKLLSTFESKQSEEIAQFKRISIPLIRRIYPKLLSTLFSQNYLLTEEDIKNLKKNEP